MLVTSSLLESVEIIPLFDREVRITFLVGKKPIGFGGTTY